MAMIYVQDMNGSPLMPTRRAGKVRHLLEDGKAAVVCRTPFTIRLQYEVPGHVQKVTLGVDAGSKTAGLSAVTASEELFKAELTLRDDIVEKISTRREARRGRRSRRSRYRAQRSMNRRSSKKPGWLAPSVRQKVDSHLRAVGLVCRLLPVAGIIVEVGQFDIQWLKDPSLTGTDYQHGPQFGFWNLREYVLSRDGHECAHCHGKSKDPVLNVHHLESRKTGGDSPDNLITLCETCHKAYHRGEIVLDVRRQSSSFRDAAFMNVLRRSIHDRLREAYPQMRVRLTYGYVTKRRRIESGIVKTHCSDAFCIAGNMGASRCDTLVLGRCVPRHSRSMHVYVPSKGGKRRSTIAPHWIGKSKLQRFDTVLYKGKECVISGSTGGRPVLRNVDWSKATDTQSVNAKSVVFVSRKHGSIIYQTANKHSF